ncbi:MAG: metallophosphoesterase [Verrucomicrobia bacterium]|nr:metallophosphoesterase [Verrucomicrobiota bacterium]
MNGRLIAVGDIHGCHVELAELLGKIAPAPDDRLVFLGDLVNRGPDSCKVIDLARQHGAICLLGNHELRLLKCHRTGDHRVLKGQDIDTFVRLRPSDWEFLAAMPLTYEDAALGVVCVHGGFLPNQDWRTQPAEVVTRIQVVDDRGRPAKRSDEPDAPLWADLWHRPPFVIYGHLPRPQVVQRPWSLGIDTACVMGGYLTAFVLPEKRLIQVKARQRYFRS